MKNYLLRAIADGIGKYSEVNIIVNTDEKPEWLSKFSEMYFDIVTNKNSHGYLGNMLDSYKIASFVKTKLDIPDNELQIHYPEIIEKFY